MAVDPNFTYNYDPSSTSVTPGVAQLSRQQWRSYVSMYVPIENQLIKYATDPQEVSKAASEASSDVNAAYDAQAGQTQRRMQGMGVQATPEQQKAIERQTGLSRAIADVNAQNVAMQNTRETQQSILGNPAPSVIKATA